jgi:hypothetical protein
LLGAENAAVFLAGSNFSTQILVNRCKINALLTKYVFTGKKK